MIPKPLGPSSEWGICRYVPGVTAQNRLLPGLASGKQQEPPRKHSLAVQILVRVLNHFPPGRRGLQHSESNPSRSEPSVCPGPLSPNQPLKPCCR